VCHGCPLSAWERQGQGLSPPGSVSRAEGLGRESRQHKAAAGSPLGLRLDVSTKQAEQTRSGVSARGAITTFIFGS